MSTKLITPFLWAIALCLYCHNTLFAQPKNATLAQWTTKNSTDQWLEFKPNHPFTLTDLVDKQKTILGLQAKDQFLVKQVKQDALGFTHHRLQQHYNEIPVEGAELLVHEKNQRLRLANEKWIRGLNINTNPTLGKETALQFALNEVPATEYAWQNEHYELILQDSKGDPAATFYPTGELVIASTNMHTQKATNYHLAYKFDIYATQPLQRLWVYVDAHTGQIINTINQLCDMDVAGTGDKTYGCAHTVDLTCHHTGNFYQLKEAGRGSGIETYTAMNDYSYPIFPVSSSDTHFEEDPVATEVHWGTEQVYDYYLSEHGRNSFDGNGAKLKSWVHYGQSYNNAFWNGNWMTYGDGDGSQFTPLVSLDVVGHEIAHGVTNYSADLVYSYEPGALNESFSDIFGALIEFYADPDCADWSIGEDITPSGNGIRNMQNPNLHSQPDTYKGDFWYTGYDQNIIVHRNSGVQNYWFYLLSEGGSGTNDNGDAYSITGIGRDKAAAIAYRNLTTYLTRTSEYADARSGAIQAAIDLYGTGSEEVLQTAAAWCAVGVGFCQATNKTLTLLSPNGGETWQQGTTQTISWNSSGTVNDVELEYSLNNGGTWTTISTATANDGSYEWTLPNVSSVLALVKITEVADNTVTDESDATFIIEGCEANAQFEVASTMICVGETLMATNTSTGATAYEWQIDAVMEGAQTDFSYTFNTAGTYILSLIATNGSNCSDSYSEVITVEAIPMAAFNYSVDGLTLHCFAEGGNGISYDWTFGDGSVASGESVNYMYAEGGEYEVCLSVAGECGMSSNCEMVSVTESEDCVAVSEQWEGYTSGQIVTKVVDAGDYLWVGTIGGLVKFHKETGEKQFFNMANSGLPLNAITALAIDQNQVLWIGTHNGLASFNEITNTWITYDNEGDQEYPTNPISALVVGTNNEIWGGRLYGNKLIKIIDGNYIEIEANLRAIRSIALGTNNNLWIGGTGRLTNFDIDSESYTTYLPENSPIPNYPVLSLVLSDNKLWIGTGGGGIASLDLNTDIWKKYTSDDSNLSSDSINVINVTTTGVWVGTEGKGLQYYDGQNWDTYPLETLGVSANYINDLILNQQNELWLGIGLTFRYDAHTHLSKINKGGLVNFSLNNNATKSYNMSNSTLESNSISDILVDKNSDIWISNSDLLTDAVNYGGMVNSARASGVTIITSDSVLLNYNINNSNLTSNYIGVFIEDSLGNIWAGGSGYSDSEGSNKLVRFNGTDWTVQTYQLPTNSPILDLDLGQNNEIWVATMWNGVQHFDGINWTIFGSNNTPLPTNATQTILYDSNDILWVGTREGLLSYDGTNWVTYNNNSSLSNAWIYDIEEDTSGHLWIGTSVGLFNYDGENWNTYTTDNSALTSNDIIGIFYTSTSDLWIEVDNGPFKGSNLIKFKNGVFEIYDLENYPMFREGIGDVEIAPSGKTLISTGLGLYILETKVNDVQAHFNTSTSSCLLAPTTFPNTSTNATTYEWQINGETISTETDLTHTFPTAGNYMVTLIATNGDCTDFYQELIRVHNNANALDLGEDQYICASSVVLDAQVSDMAGYFWDFEGNNVGSEQTYTATQSGVYTLSVLDSCGNAHFDEIEILLDDNCVWPGDYNYDNVVDNHDLLRVGLAFGDMGPQRPNASLSWGPQACPNWEGNYTPNFKHIDGDGNGVIDLNDQQAIRQNYGQTHGTVPTYSPGQNPLTLTAIEGEAPASFGQNTVLEIEIHLANEDGEDSNNNVSAYGIAFDIDYIIPDAVQVNRVYFQAANSWLGTASYDMMTLDHHTPSNYRSGNLAVALCRTDRQNRTSYGRVGTAIVEVDVLPTLDTIRDVAVDLSKIEMVINNGISIIGGQGQGGSSMNLAGGNANFNITTAPTLTQLHLDAFLPYAYNTANNTMQPKLKEQNQLPAQQPFNTYPWFYEGEEGVNQVADLPANMVDWLLVEVQNETGQMIAQKAVALLADGTITDVQTGIDLNTVALAGLANNENYYVLLRHRHHIDVVSAIPVMVTDLTLTIDFSDPTQVMGGADQLMDMGSGKYGLIAGDATGDGIINVQDFNAYQKEQTQPTPYSPTDFNLDGQLTVDDFNAYQENASHIGVSRVRY